MKLPPLKLISDNYAIEFYIDIHKQSIRQRSI